MEAITLPSINSHYIDTTPAWKRMLLSQTSILKKAINTDNFADIYYFSAVISPTAASIDGGDVPNDVRDKLKHLGGDVVASDTKAVQECKGTLEKLQETKPQDKPAWQKTIVELGEDLKRKSAENIDRATKAAIETIGKLPEGQREAAAQVWQTVVNWVTALLAKVWDFFKKIIDAILRWIEDMWKKVKAWFKAIFDVLKSVFSLETELTAE